MLRSEPGLGGTMQESALLARTRQLYRDRPASLKVQTIARETGLSVEWLRDLGWGREGDKGVNKVETLYVYLTGKPLNLEA